MLQNRVDPQGNLIQTSARGAWLGNRGQLHGSGKTILRAYKHRTWIICLLQFKGRHREIMSPNLWTELFFLDEATAFAAGHRPCFECRRQAANQFKAAWIKGNPDFNFDGKVLIAKIDAVTHRQRIDQRGKKVTFETDIDSLPDGTFIWHQNEPYLVSGKMLHCWSSSGYDKSVPKPPAGKVIVLTPLSTVNAYRAGYRPQMAIDDNNS